MERVAVVGTTGSGKTTLARVLAGTIGARYVELDALHWGPDGTPAPEATFRAHVDAALCGGRWVADGDYGAVRDLVWTGADTLVWLDFSIGVVLTRLTKRTLVRGLGREEPWNGNRERVWEPFAKRDSLYLRALRTHGSRRARYERLLQGPAYAHLAVARLSTPARVPAWLAARAAEAREAAAL